MRPSVFVALLAALLAFPAAALAQTGDAGPDQGMIDQTKAAHRDLPTPAEREAGAAKTATPTSTAAASPTAAPARSPVRPPVRRPATPRADRARCRKLSDADIATAPIAEARGPSRHQATIGGKAIAYTATAGTLTLRDDEGKPTGSMFYVAYTTGEPNRPVTFFYNGGPGSATVWLHMGSLAPVRVLTDSPEPTHGPPYQLVNNDASLLDKSDLVFLDAMGAGYSRPLGDTKLAAFWGTDQDIDAFARGIERWLTINGRWNAPKFLFGESYGTTRSAGLVLPPAVGRRAAERRGAAVLGAQLRPFRPGFEQDMIDYIPSYAAIAAYHHKLAAAARRPAELPEGSARVRPGTVRPGSGQGAGPGRRRRQAVAEKLSSYIGLPTSYILDSNLRIDPVALSQGAAARPAPDHRPLRRPLHRPGCRRRRRDPGIRPVGHRHHRRLRRRLPRLSGPRPGLRNPASTTGRATTRPACAGTSPQGRRPWRRRRRQPGRRGARPVAGDAGEPAPAGLFAERHLRLGDAVLRHRVRPRSTCSWTRRCRGNVRFAYYPSGHMVYLNPDALKSMKADLARFYDEAAPH